MEVGMQKYFVEVQNGHMIAKIDDENWLLDTGSASSFGVNKLKIDGASFDIKPMYMGLSPEKLSEYIDVKIAGLVGGDVLSKYDHLFDCPNREWIVSEGDTKITGQAIPVKMIMGIPVVVAQIDGKKHKMFFDTGAQVGYWLDEAITNFPPNGQVKDFYPGYGIFETQTYNVQVTMGEFIFTEKCGILPTLLGMSIKMAGVNGILGNQLLRDRCIGYYPRKNMLVL